LGLAPFFFPAFISLEDQFFKRIMSIQKTSDDKKCDWRANGDALLAGGKYKDAIKALDKAIEINPQFKDAWFNKGNALRLLGRTREAYEALIKVKELKRNISKRTKRTL
jgi:tetratricopeptide (TPR) repeat protein